jgi:hypothetical protein
MSTDVGEIVGYLRLDGTQFREEVAAAIAELRVLSGQTVNVDVKSDGLARMPSTARSAAASLDALQRVERDVADATNRVNLAQLRLSELNESGKAKASQLMNAQMALTKARRAEQDAIMATYASNLALSAAEERAAASAGRASAETDKYGKSAAAAQRSTGALLTSMLLLGPAILPLAAGATAVALAFGGMGVAGITAFMGIKDEMSRGTTVGLAYMSGINQLASAFARLSDVAAVNILGDFENTVAGILLKMPTLTTEIGQLATMTGHAASAVIGGLLNAFIQLAPFLDQVVAKIVGLANEFETFTAGNGFAKFAGYITAELPDMINFLSQLVELVAHLVAALLPFGSGILSALEVFISALNSIPINMLTLLAQLALSVFAGFKTWEALTGIIEGVVETLKALNTTLEISEGVLRNVDIAASVIGVAIAAFSLILAHNSEASEEAKQKQEAYADALRDSKGAVDDAVRSVAAKQLEEEKALQTAEELGFSLSDVTSAAIGQKDAVEKVIPALDGMVQAGQKTITTQTGTIHTSTEMAQKAAALKEAILGQTDALQSQIRTQKAVDAASAVTQANMTLEEQKTQALAHAYHMSTTAYQAATQAQKDDAASLATTTAKMQLENDAAGLLKNALDRLNGKAISAAQAQQQFDSSLVSMTKAQNSAGKAVHITSGNINDLSSASVQVRGSLNQQITALEQVVEANGGLSNSTGNARAQMMRMRTEIINNAVAHGVDRKAVTDYIDKLLKIPKSIPPTKLQVDKAGAEAAINAFRAHLLSLAGKTVTTYVRTYTSTYDTMGGAGGVSGHGMLRKFRGGIESFREGGFRDVGFQSFADGKLPSQAMIAPDGANLVQWAERGTGDEAFIPLGSGNHARSVAIWEEAGRRLGMAVGAHSSLAGLEITGTLDTPWGPSELRGLVRSEIKSAGEQSVVSDRLRNGVGRA